MKHKIIRIIRVCLALLLFLLALFIIIKPDTSINILDNLLYKITNTYYFSDINEKNNKDEIIKVYKNKDYTNSIYYPYYELLNSNEKQIYIELYNNALEYSKSFIPSVNIISDELSNIFESLTYDHPEIFWLNNSFSYYINEKNEVQSILLNYNETINDIENARNRFNEEIKKIVNEANTKNTDYEKELFVHDKLINILEYDYNNESNHNLYDAIINKKAYCDGYTKLFQIIMTKLNIPTYYIFGYANENHSWNLIELEDGFYNVDVTWDDQRDRTIYRYFNLNDKMINKDHERRNKSIEIIRKNGEKYINKLSPLYE